MSIDNHLEFTDKYIKDYYTSEEYITFIFGDRKNIKVKIHRNNIQDLTFNILNLKINNEYCHYNIQIINCINKVLNYYTIK